MTCFCMGPQNGEPLCPCRMRSVEVKGGRYVHTIDFGPVPDPETKAILQRMKDKLTWIGETDGQPN